jgi:hypothetical protein
MDAWPRAAGREEERSSYRADQKYATSAAVSPTASFESFGSMTLPVARCDPSWVIACPSS